jgi:hypothetical protein
VIDAQQGQKHAFGFINPAIYKLAGTKAFADALPETTHSPAADRGLVCPAADCGAKVLITNDDQSHSFFGYTGQVTLKGYDNMTGLGVPNGASFTSAMRKIEG